MSDKRVAGKSPDPAEGPVNLGIPMHGAKYIIAGRELYLGDVTFDVNNNVQLTFYRAADLPEGPEHQERKLGVY